ncbi:FUSC family protein [Proteus myxofaciens]|uniref:Putative membrane protein n=1 Tax=Proteus myxofaciens ATCC 19692 TaxID=1354337 RepID=A0A198FDM0_9GAMM|nr:FUSC family protein [Proteus myxofaciens]OAT22865.1 putative membrane protein [Proteus myxofaciens ATCC 19692]
MKETLFNRIHNSLLPYPGRGNQTARTVVSCVLVVLISLTLQVPYIPLCIIVVFFLTQTNVVITKIIGILFVIAGTAAILISLLIIMVTWHSPFLRILFSSLVFLVSLFLMRTTKVGILFFIISIVVIYAQSLVDVAPNAELLTREILWVWVAVIYTIVVTLIVNTLLLPVEPEKQLRDFLLYQLNIVNRCLNPSVNSTPDDHNMIKAGMDLQAMYKYLKFSIMRHKGDDFDKQYYVNKITIISELRSLSANLPSEFDNAKDKNFAMALSDILDVLETSLDDKTPLEQHIINLELTDNAILNKIYFTLKNYIEDANNYHSEDEIESILQKVNPPKESFLVDDAFTNSKYIVFALKTLLSVLLSYFIYTLTDWNGISTFMLSCLIIAQPGLGNVQRKIILRLSGALIGGALALFSIMFITNQLDSIFGLLILIIPVFFLAAWVATGQENISYAGIQIAYTFSLALLETSGPVYELVDVRDRIIGIILGIILGSIIQSFIAPEREGSIIMSKLASIIDLIRKEWNPTATKPPSITREDIAIKLFECNDLISLVTIEPTWMDNESSHDKFNQHAQEIFFSLKNIIYSYDKLLLQFDNIKNNLASEDKKNVIDMINKYKNNLLLISLRLQGARTSPPHYPDIKNLPDNQLKLSMVKVEQDMQAFFNIG